MDEMLFEKLTNDNYNKAIKLYIFACPHNDNVTDHTQLSAEEHTHTHTHTHTKKENEIFI